METHWSYFQWYGRWQRDISFYVSVSVSVSLSVSLSLVSVYIYIYIWGGGGGGGGICTFSRTRLNKKPWGKKEEHFFSSTEIRTRDRWRDFSECSPFDQGALWETGPQLSLYYPAFTSQSDSFAPITFSFIALISERGVINVIMPLVSQGIFTPSLVTAGPAPHRSWRWHRHKNRRKVARVKQDLIVLVSIQTKITLI